MRRRIQDMENAKIGDIIKVPRISIFPETEYKVKAVDIYGNLIFVPVKRNFLMYLLMFFSAITFLIFSLFVDLFHLFKEKLVTRK